MTRALAEEVACAEDGPRWFARDGETSRWAVIRQEARDHGIRPLPWRFTVRKRHMRDATAPADCPALIHEREDDDDDRRDHVRDKGCRCAELIDDGWRLVCPADHPAAFPVWEVDYRYAILPWPLRRFLVRLHPATRRRGRGGVLWGSHPPRRVRWFDRVLLGPTAGVVIYTDFQLRPWLTLERERWARESEAAARRAAMQARRHRCSP